MDVLSSKKRQKKYHFGLQSDVAEIKFFSCVLCAPLELPREAQIVDSPEDSMDAGDLLKENIPEATLHGCQNNSAVRSKREHKSAKRRIDKKSTSKLCKQKEVRKWSLNQDGFKSSEKTGSNHLPRRPTMTEQLCKTQFNLLKHHLKDRSDVTDDGETLLRKIATAYPKYSQMIRTLPVLLNMIPGELKEKLMIKENVKLLNMGAHLVNNWITKPV
ncbi:unnamed protein product [Penicillium salamii]|uniref:Uncharacterized protein n=1 Tax=Penicillium salamii TaxID=1612424 RepID=A0A9W4IMF0_9EURO|nr:unnamed protein product [Penicillium salamii]